MDLTHSLTHSRGSHSSAALVVVPIEKEIPGMVYTTGTEESHNTAAHAPKLPRRTTVAAAVCARAQEVRSRPGTRPNASGRRPGLSPHTTGTGTGRKRCTNSTAHRRRGREKAHNTSFNTIQPSARVRHACGRSVDLSVCRCGK